MKQTYRVLSGSALKVLAMGLMLIDHLAAFYWRMDPQFMQPLFAIGHKPMSAYLLMRLLGRLAFPVFAFLLVEGFVHTSNRRRYGFILLLYVLRRQPVLQAVIGSCVLGSRWIAGLAFIPINMYNGQRGFIRGSLSKYIFYVFYPLHLFVIYLLRSM